MAQAQADTSSLQEQGFLGEVHHPGSPGYDAALHTWGKSPRGNQQRPLVAIRPRGTRDCSLVVRWTLNQKLDLAVKGNGHSAANLSLVEGAVLLDLSLMRGVFVDPQAKTAAVEGGAWLADVDAETGLHNLAVPLGHVPCTGMGLPLNGGFGIASGAHGLACHHVIHYTLVTGDGSVITVDKDSDPELLWGLNGAATAFGIITKLVFRLNDVSNFYGGMVMWRDDPEHVTWRKLAKWIRDVGFKIDAFNMPLYQTVTPDGKPSIISLVSHLGQESQEEKAQQLAFIQDPELEPIMSTVGKWSYAQTQNSFAPLAASVPQHYESPALVQLTEAQVTDELLDSMCTEMIDKVPRDRLTNVLIVLDSMGGKVKTQKGPVGFGKQSDFYMLALVGWMDPQYTEEGIAFSSKVKQLGLQAGGLADAYSNLSSTVDSKLALRCGGEDRLQRLRALKKKWDEKNFFNAHPFHGL